MRTIQEIVDALAEHIGEPVGVDDRRYRAVAYSAHSGEMDEVRRASIICREPPPEARDHIDRLGLDRASGAVWIPACPEVGMAARVCVPIRFNHVLVGYLWLLDGPNRRGPHALPAVEESLGELGAALYRQLRLSDDARSREAGLVDALVRSDADVHAAGAELKAGGLASASRYVVMVATCAADAVSVSPDEREVGFGVAVERLRRGMRPRQLAASVTSESVVVVIGLEGEELTRWANALRAAVTEHLDVAGDGGIVVGVGAPRAALSDLRAAYDEAVSCTRVASTTGTIALWDRLGAYRLVTRLLGERDPLSLLPQSLRRLLEDADADTLVRTAESYLDHAGCAPASAAELYIHRSSLYNRLRRIEEVAGIDLRSGDDRLELHLGLRLWKLVGEALPPPATEHAPAPAAARVVGSLNYAS